MRRHRTGVVLALMAMMAPIALGIVGLLVDGGLMLSEYRADQNVADAAATAGAMDLLQGKSISVATQTSQTTVQQYNALPDAKVTVNNPPASGNYAGQSRYLEVLVSRQLSMNFVQMLGANAQQTISTRSVAGYETATQGGALVVLDPDPAPLSIPALPISLPLPSLPALIGGLEVLGAGTVQVQGAVLVNTKWGGVDENGRVAGLASPPYGVACTPLIGLTSLAATDIRVAGGVDSLSNYHPLTSRGTNPVEGNRLAVPDPLSSLPAPTTSSDATNVNATLRGSVTVVGLPLIGPPVILQPGVYEWIEVVSGIAVFQPGVYIIRNVNPVTGMALSLVAGQITANGVMFYITNSSGYSATSGSPDSGDGETSPAGPYVTTLLPSVVVNLALTGSQFSPLSSSGSPFNGMMFYQRRQDRRPMIFVQESLLGGGTLQGTVYAKWGHVLLAGQGTYNARIASGTMRIVALLDMTIAPTTLFSSAYDVFLVE
jgi:Flp pilus assembly protein TadG